MRLRPLRRFGVGRRSSTAPTGSALLPWAFWLSSSLRRDSCDSAHWDLAWSGFDVGLAACFCGDGDRRVARLSAWVGAFAAATGTMLIVDAGST